MKARNSNISISPYGGVLPILKNIKESGIPQLIRSTLGKRVEQAKYGYDDILIAWIVTSLCGGKRLDHITKLRKSLKVFKGLKIPSHDTLGRAMKQLATETIEKDMISRYKKKLTANTNYFNDNFKMNNMLLKATKRMGGLKEGISYILHIDATFIDTLCIGSNMAIDKSKSGFNPMVCTIGDLVIYVSMRNGNSSADFNIKECMEQCLDILQENKIKIGKVISDGAGYNVALIEMLEKRGIKFNIHAPTNAGFKTMVKQLDQSSWNETVIETAREYRGCEISEIQYTMHGGYRPFRVIAARIPNMSGKNRSKYVVKKMAGLQKKKKLKNFKEKYPLGNWKVLGNYRMKLIITNDYSKTPTELIMEYNKRGDSERKFTFMKNEFGWKLPPFQHMNENVVFFIAAALANNTMRAMVKKFKKDIPQLRLNARLPDFIHNFIIVCVGYINEEYIFYDPPLDYVKLLT